MGKQQQIVFVPPDETKTGLFNIPKYVPIEFNTDERKLLRRMYTPEELEKKRPRGLGTRIKKILFAHLTALDPKVKK